MNSFTPNSRSHLLIQLRADQSRHWQQGERVFVEHYLEQYPSLASDPEAVLDLIGTERLFRQEKGEQPDLQEYLLRFPQHADALRRGWSDQPADQPRPRADSDEPTSTLKEQTQPNGPRRRTESVPSLPGFQLHEKLGEGGMGVVYRAWDLGLGQPRAVKVIRGGFISESSHERFQREARAAARLDHPGVVRIFSLGEHDGDLFISMEFLEGGNLSDRLRQGPLEVRAAAEFMRQLALAVQHAHENKVLHRDLKPANVLLDGDGKPKVGDFGLAKLLDEDDGLTRTGEVMGTPSYMAPEQAEGRVTDIGARTDLWALGAIFYECLTGRPPFRGASRSHTLEMVKRERPLSPRRQRPELPAALETICLTCLRKRPEERYATAAELAADLQAWLDGKPLLARPRRPRRRVGIALLAAALLAGLTFAVFVPPRPKPVTDASAAAPAKPLPGVWNSLLTREPTVLRWPEGDGQNTKLYQPNEQQLLLSCRERGLLALGETSASRYQLQVAMQQTPWVGQIGLFFGYRDGRDAQGRPAKVYQAVTLTSHLPENVGDGKKGQFQLDWLTITEGVNQQRTHSLGGSRPFNLAPKEYHLTLTVGPEGMEAVTLDGIKEQTLAPLWQRVPGAAIPGPEEYKGAFGIFIESGHGIFRDARYLFHEEP